MNAAWDTDAPQRLAAALEQVEQGNVMLREGLAGVESAALELGLRYPARSAESMNADRLLAMVPLAMLRSDVVAAFSVRIEQKQERGNA